jgi:hypothetical protein
MFKVEFYTTLYNEYLGLIFVNEFIIDLNFVNKISHILILF